MSRIAYFDCFAGAGGDMIVGALLDAGCPFAALQEHLGRLNAPSARLTAEKVNRGGIVGTQFAVQVAPGPQPHRSLGEILGLIEAAGLPPRAAERARRVFQRLAEAEAKVHHIDVQEVHFHEVGALDSIMDIVGACTALELLEVERVGCSPLPTGRGTVQTEHGRLPVPAPATAELLIGARTAGTDLTGEVLTPTAAALLSTLSETWGPLPAMEVSAVGYGAGSRSDTPLPNLLRVYLGCPAEAGEVDTVVELACNLDDCPGQWVAAAMEAALSAGALDAWAAPITMKKSRPGTVLSVLCEPADVQRMEDILFRQTTTFGVRRRLCQRTKLARHHQTVATPYGPIRVKVGQRAGQPLAAAPEYEDCRAAAEAHHVSLREVFRCASEAYHRDPS